MSIQFVNRSEGLPAEEIAGRLSTGWLCVTDVAVEGPALAVPGQPEVGKFVDVWMAPAYGAMMPQLAVVQALLTAEDSGDDVITLDDLSKMLFKQSLRQLRQAVTEQPKRPEGEPNEAA